MRGVSLEYYGSTTVGERGQVVLPAKLRKKFNMKKGDTYFVLKGEQKGEQIGGAGVVLVKADVFMGLASKFFGKDLNKMVLKKE